MGVELLVNGVIVKGEPFFKTQEEYDGWEREFYEAIKPEMDENLLRRTRSEHASRYHIVD